MVSTVYVLRCAICFDEPGLTLNVTLALTLS